MSNRESYKAAFRMLSAQKKFEDSLTTLGFRFDYGDGPFGMFAETIIDNADTIVQNTLGLHIKRETKTNSIAGTNYPIDMEILYTDDEDPKWSISCDDFYSFFYEAANDEYLQDLMWKIMVEKDTSAKEEYNALKKFGKINPFNR